MRTARRSIAHGSIFQTAKESILTLIHNTSTQRFQIFFAQSFLFFFIAVSRKLQVYYRVGIRANRSMNSPIAFVNYLLNLDKITFS